MANTDSGTELNTPKNPQCGCNCMKAKLRLNRSVGKAKASVASKRTSSADLEALSGTSERAGTISKTARVVFELATADPSFPQNHLQLDGNARLYRNELSEETLVRLPSEPSQLVVWSKTNDILQNPVSITERQLSATQIVARQDMEELNLALGILCKKLSKNNHGCEVSSTLQPSSPSLPNAVQPQCTEWSSRGLELQADEGFNDQITMRFEIDEEDHFEIGCGVEAAPDSRLAGQNTPGGGEPRLVDELFRGLDARHNDRLDGNPDDGPQQTSKSRMENVCRATSAMLELQPSTEEYSSSVSVSVGGSGSGGSSTMNPSRASSTPSLYHSEVASINTNTNSAGLFMSDEYSSEYLFENYTYLPEAPTSLYDYPAASRHDYRSTPRFIPQQ